MKKNIYTAPSMLIVGIKGRVICGSNNVNVIQGQTISAADEFEKASKDRYDDSWDNGLW